MAKEHLIKIYGYNGFEKEYLLKGSGYVKIDGIIVWIGETK